MPTTPSRKVTDGKKRSSHRSMDEDRPYYGDPETLKSAGARADDIPKVCAPCSVEGEAAHPDMTNNKTGHRNDGWPEKVQG